MLFRRALAWFFILLFTVVALPTFLFFGFSNSFLRQSFYEGPVSDATYDFLLKVTAKSLIAADEALAAHFTEGDLRSEMMTVFPSDLFKKMVADFAGQVEKLKADPQQPLTISLKVFRESLLTFANNLSFRLFESLPVCKEGQIPGEDVKGLPSCIPEGVEYNDIASPFAAKFEDAVYAAVPEQIQIDLNAAQGQSGVTPAAVFRMFSAAKMVLFAVLLLLLILIALLIYSPFSLIAKYVGAAFAISGIFGYLLSFGLSQIPRYLPVEADTAGFREDFVRFAEYLVSFVSAESQKIALIFLAVGAILILMRLFLAHKYSNES